MGAQEVIRLEHWSPAVERGLLNAVGPYALDYAHQVNSGDAELYQVGNGYLITRYDEFKSHAPQLVVCALEGVEFHHIAPLLIGAAGAQGAHSIRYHTERKALGRMGRRYGARLSEYVYEVPLNHGA